MNIDNDLIHDIINQNVILFVGAGVSMNLGLPSWSKLIDQMALDLGFEPEQFKNNGSFLELAEYYNLKKGSIGSLRSWMDTNFHSSDIKIENSKIHKLLLELNFDLIYTTNYDRWIEKAFDYYKKPYQKIIGIHDFTQSVSGTTKIVKYHGDFDDDSSIVLTETSYFDRLDLNTALDVKLRADSLGKSLLFLGYSLNDLDIRFLLYKLQLLWRQDLSSVQPTSYVFLTEDNPIKRKVLESRNIQTIASNESDPGKALEFFLEKLVHEVKKRI